MSSPLNELPRDEINDALDRLNKYISDKVNNSNRLFGSGNMPLISESYEGHSFRRTNLSKSTISAHFKHCSFTGSKFIDVVFEGAILDSINMQFCEFYNVTIRGSGEKTKMVRAANLDSSLFVKCRFEHFVFEDCGFANAEFVDCVFVDCDISMCALDSANFCSCVFKQCDFTMINIEYCEFDDCKYDDLILPVSQAPFIYGFEFQMKSEGIRYATDYEIIDAKEYESILDDLTVFFAERDEYFAVSNILSFKGQRLEALDYLKQGTTSHAKMGDYRMVQHYCKLANNLAYSRKEMLELFGDLLPQLIVTHTLIDDNSHQDYRIKSYLHNIEAIQRNCLEATGDVTSTKLTLMTDVNSADEEERIRLIRAVESILDREGHSFHTTSFQHNSDLVIMIDIPTLVSEINAAIDYLQNCVFPELTKLGYDMMGNALWDFTKLSASSIAAFFVGTKKTHHGKHAKNSQSVKAKKTSCS